MKARTEILLWRHAEAEDTNAGGDLARELTAHGRKQAEHMGRWLDERLPKGARILVSPAVRAQQTALGLKRKFATELRAAPDSSAKRLLAAAAWPSTACTLIIGHQPILGEVAAMLITGSEKGWPIRKGALWWIWLRPGQPRPSLRAAIDPALL